MISRKNLKLNPKKRYLQVALNNTLDEAYAIINDLPVSDRIIVEAGTPLIKRYGEVGIKQVVSWYGQRIAGVSGVLEFGAAQKRVKLSPVLDFFVSQMKLQMAQEEKSEEDVLRDIVNQFFLPKTSEEKPQLKSPTKKKQEPIFPYVVADLKTMDRAEAEVQMAARAGASAAVALGTAPLETLNSFVEQCQTNGLDSMIDMMNIDFPLSVLLALKKVPDVVILHRGVDEEKFNKQKMIPLHEIRRIKGAYDIMISIAGGDTLREVQSSVFNDADIVVIWKSVFQKTEETAKLVDGFLKEVK
jgi:3-keto-L-gulonate-6-phosphate decarboxylase